MADLEKDFDKEPDLSKQFDSESDLHSQFDKEPSQGMGDSAQARGEIEKPSQLEAGARGLAQGATLGFGDELYGAGRGALEKMSPSESTKDMSLKDLYQMYRDSQRAKNKSAEQAYPKTYLAGNVVGGIAPMALTGGSLPAAVGAGAAMGLGSSEADLTQGDIGGAAKDTAIGAGLGLAGGMAGKGLEAVGQKVLKPMAGKLAEGALGGASKEGRNVGQTVLDENALPLMGGSKATKDAIQNAINENEAKAGNLLREANDQLYKQQPEGLTFADELGPKVLKRFNDDILPQFDTRTPIGRQQYNDVLKNTRPHVEDILNAGSDLVKLQNIKTSIYRQIRALDESAYAPNGSMVKNVDPEISALKQLGGMVKEQIEKTGDSVGGDLGSQIKDVNAKLGDLYEAGTGASKLMKKDLIADSKLPVGGMGAASGIGGALLTGHPGVAAGIAAGYVGKKAVEGITGQPLARAAGITAAKGAQAMGQLAESPVGASVAKSAVTSPFTQDAVTGRNKNLDPGYSVYQASDEQLQSYNNQIKNKPTLANISTALDRYFKSGDVMDKNVAAFLIQSTPEAKEAMGLK